MADAAIVSVSDDSHYERRARSNYVWVTTNQGYYIRMQAGAGSLHTRRVDMFKTTDGGATTPWTKTELFDTGVNADIIEGVDSWYDQWGRGDNGTLIHVFLFHETSTNMFGTYITIDTNDDTVATVNTNPLGGGASGGAGIRTVSMVKLESGTLRIGMSASGTHEVWESTDSGTNWTQLSADPGRETAESQFVDYPTDSTDNEDQMRIQWGNTSNILQANIWDDSAGTWTQTTIGTSGDFIWQGGTPPESNRWSSTYRQSDRTVIVAIHEDGVGTSHDLRVFTIHWDGATLTITELTRVLTATSTVGGVSILIDNRNDNLHVTYLDGTEGSVTVQQVVSTDGGIAWGAATQISDDTDDFVAVWDAPQNIESGRTHPIFNLDSASAQSSLPKQGGTDPGDSLGPPDGTSGPNPPGDVILPGGDDGDDGLFGQGFGVFPPVLELMEAGGSNGAALQGGPDIVEANEVELGPAQERLDITEGNEVVVVSG